MTRRRAATGATAACLAGTLLLAGCIGGRVLRGYPGYPFLTFRTAAPADSLFFDLQGALVEDGFPLDYSRLEDGLITTRPSRAMELPVFLNVVVEPLGEAGGSRAWVAGYLQTEAGPRRINPDDEELWPRVAGATARLSGAVGGSDPLGPDERGGPGGGDPPSAAAGRVPPPSGR